MSTPERGTKRLPALDGVRGVAAAVVVVHHALLTVPVLATPYFVAGVVGDPRSLNWWLTYTPLHLFWDGTAAVYLFFVLSGVVLTLPVLARGDDYRWGSYYVQRLLRIYLPVWAAVALAALNIALIHRGPHPSPWLNANQDPVGVSAVINDLGLLTQRGFLASPLWSLHWEVLFSLLLPVFVWLAVQLGRRSWLLLPIALAAVAAGDRLMIPELKFLPMFLVGTVLGLTIHHQQQQRPRSILWTVCGLGAAVLVCLPWVARAAGAGATAVSVCEALVVAACAAMLLSALHSRPFRYGLESRPAQFLGRISFSWYLVHEPIVIGVAFLGMSSSAAIPLSIALSLAVAVAFHVIVEQPCHRIARRAGRRPFSSSRTERSHPVRIVESTSSRPAA